MFTIDALGRHRTRKVGAAPTDTYTYAGASEAVVRIEQSPTVYTDSALDANADRLATKTSTGAFGWLLPDLHGDVAGALNSAGTAVSDAFRYDPYGKLIGSTTSAVPSPWRYQGRLLETTPGGTEPDLYGFGFRAYSPTLGAFTSLDDVAGSAQNPLSLNRFLYAAANPETLIDPDGHWFGLDDLVASVGGAIIGGGAALVADVISGQGVHIDHVVSGAAGGAATGETLLLTGGTSSLRTPWAVLSRTRRNRAGITSRAAARVDLISIGSQRPRSRVPRWASSDNSVEKSSGRLQVAYPPCFLKRLAKPATPCGRPSGTPSAASRRASKRVSGRQERHRSPMDSSVPMALGTVCKAPVPTPVSPSSGMRVESLIRQREFGSTRS